MQLRNMCADWAGDVNDLMNEKKLISKEFKFADHGGDCEAGGCICEPLICNDGNGCTDDTCDAKKGCQYQANFEDCDDGDLIDDNECTNECTIPNP